MKELLQNMISEALKKQNIKKEAKDIIVEIPKISVNGDYSSNIAMQLSKELHKSPIEIAELIKNGTFNEQIEKIEIAGPGFLNFFVKKIIFSPDDILKKGIDIMKFYFIIESCKKHKHVQ